MLEILILVFLIGVSAFFSGIEIALVSISMIKVKSLVKEKKRGSEALYRIKQNPHRMLITILTGNTVANVASASLATVIFTDLFGSSVVGITTGVMTFVILVFGAITPKTFAAQNVERVSLLVARPVELLSYIMSPIVTFFESISQRTSKLLGSKEEKQLSGEELKMMVTMGVREGILNREAAEMIRNLLEFEGTKVTDIMTPKADIEMIDSEAKLKDIIDFVVKMSYSRYPAYSGDGNKIVGVLDVDDVLKYVKNKKMDVKVKDIARQAYFVPESKEIDDLLSEFESKDVPLALIVDEYGNVSGLVTIEDILEEIVGDIFNKSGRESVHIKKVSDRLIRVDAKASIEEINRVLHLGLRGKQFNTIAGFIEHKLQRIPEGGEVIRLKKVTIEVDKVTPQGVKSVKIIRS